MRDSFAPTFQHHAVEVDVPSPVATIVPYLPLKCLLDGQVGGEVSELDKGVDVVEHLERGSDASM